MDSIILKDPIIVSTEVLNINIFFYYVSYFILLRSKSTNMIFLYAFSLHNVDNESHRVSEPQLKFISQFV